MLIEENFAAQAKESWWHEKMQSKIKTPEKQRWKIKTPEKQWWKILTGFPEKKNNKTKQKKEFLSFNAKKIKKLILITYF